MFSKTFPTYLPSYRVCVFRLSSPLAGKMTATTWNLDVRCGALLKRNKCLVTQRTSAAGKMGAPSTVNPQPAARCPLLICFFFFFLSGAHPKSARAFLTCRETSSSRSSFLRRGLPYLVRLHWRCTFVTLSDRSVYLPASPTPPYRSSSSCLASTFIAVGSTFCVLAVLNHRWVCLWVSFVFTVLCSMCLRVLRTGKGVDGGKGSAA